MSHLVTPARFDECAIYASSSLVVGNLCELGINISCLKFAAATTGSDWLRTVSRFLLLRLALTAGVIASVFLLAPVASTKLLRHPEYATALRLACGSAAWPRYRRSAWCCCSRGSSSRAWRGRARSRPSCRFCRCCCVFRGRMVRGGRHCLAGDILSRLVDRRRQLRPAGRRAGERPGWRGPRPAWKPIAVFANWITLSTVIGSLYNYIPSIALSRWATAAALGTYSLGMALTGGFALLINTTSTVLLPEAVAATTAERRRSYLRSYLPGSRAAGRGACWSRPGSADSSPHICFRPPCRMRVRVFQLLATAQIALLVANPVQFLLYGAGRPHGARHPTL